MKRKEQAAIHLHSTDMPWQFTKEYAKNIQICKSDIKFDNGIYK
jgi:hypothetical protein